jgi:hypothetical protein
MPQPAISPNLSKSLTMSDLFPESDVQNVGNTRPPQNLRHFAGNEIEKTYLTYFVAGDVHTYRHGTKVRVEGGTTHPAQLELLTALFGIYVKPIFEPTLTPRGQYGIRATFDLSPSFDFLLDKPKKIDRLILRDDRLFYSALSGFSDAEGHVGLRRRHVKAYAEYALSNRNSHLMHDFTQGLNSREHNVRLYALRHQGIQWQLEANGRYALKLLPNIGFRHREKIAGVKIAMANDRKPWRIAGPLYLSYRAGIKSEREALESIASKRWRTRGGRKQQRRRIFIRRLESSFPLFAKGLTVQEVAQRLHCSTRTACRRMEKFKNKEDTTRNRRDDSTYP